MKLILKKIKNLFITVLLIAYFLHIICVSILLIAKNDYGVTQFNDKTLILVNNDIANDKYKNGDLIILKSITFEKLKKGQEIFLYKTNEKNKTVEIIISNIESIEIDEINPYVTLEKDGSSWNSDYIAGTYYKSYNKIGCYLSFIESKWIFFAFLLVPGFFIFLYEIYKIVILVKYDDFEEDLTVKEKQQDIINDNLKIEFEDDSSLQNINESTKSFDQKINNDIKDEKSELNGVSKITILNDDNNDLKEKIQEYNDELDDVQINNAEELEDLELNNNGLDETNLEIIDQNEEQQSNISNIDELYEKNSLYIPEDDDMEFLGQKIFDTLDELEEAEKSKIIIGKNEKNIVKKGLDLKKNEIIEITNKIISFEKPSNEYKLIISKIANYYVKEKYLLPAKNSYELKTKLFSYFNKVVLETDKNISRKRIATVANAIMLINDFNNSFSNVEDVIKNNKVNNFEENIKPILVEEITKITKNYEKTMENYFKKIESGKFELVLKKIEKNYFNTNLVSNLKFSKIFSDYFIDKSYNDEVVSENLKEVQLRLISCKILKELLNQEYERKYLIFFNKSLYKKVRKFKTILSTVNDDFSQGKINILVNYDILKNYKKEIESLRQLGYNFCLELTYDELVKIDDNKKYLCMFDKTFIIHDKMLENEVSKNIPMDYYKNIVFVKETLIGKVVIK